MRAASLPEEDPARDEAEDEADDLLAEHEEEWAGRAADLLLERQWRRGCIEHGTAWADTLLSEGKELFSLAPIRSLRLLAEADDLPRLAGCPFLQRVEALDVSAGQGPTSIYRGTYHRDLALANLLASPHLSRLTHLEARSQGIEGPLLRTLIDRGVMARLVRLDLHGNRSLGDTAVRTLAGAGARQLEMLDVFGTNVTAAGLQTLLRSEMLPRLHDLEFGLGLLRARIDARGDPARAARVTGLFSFDDAHRGERHRAGGAAASPGVPAGGTVAAIDGERLPADTGAGGVAGALSEPFGAARPPSVESTGAR